MTSRKDKATGGATALPSAHGHLGGRELAVAAVLAVLTFTLYIPSFYNGFVDYDDHHYVTQNKVVQKGLSREGFVWAFTTTKFANWLPVTWLSHELDCELWGLKAGGHHATSALLHAFNAVALFFALSSLTGRFWEPAVAAALFAVHPLRVESVAWVAERKDVLCSTFFMLALLAYASYSRRPSVGRYLLVVLCHALGLMSKTMLVTLPCLLLLLDYWPLRRMRIGAADPEDASEFPPQRLGWLVLEKLPLVALSIVSSAWTVVFQSSGGAMWGYRDLTMGQRVANAIVSIPRYLVKIAWPVDLSVFYPHPGSWPASKILAAAALVAVLSILAALEYRRRPYVTVGWFWFLGMLVPVSGIIQVGLQSMADRYTYLPAIGLTVAVVWSAAEMVRRHPPLVVAAGAMGLLVAFVFSVVTVRQQAYWKNTYTLFEQALRADPDNWLANNMIGGLWAVNGERAFESGDMPRAKMMYEEAQRLTAKSLAINPTHYTSLHNQGWNLYRLGRPDEAMEYFRKSIGVNPDFGASHLYLGLILAQKGRLDEAMPLFEEAVRLQPWQSEAHQHLAEALLQKGEKAEAIEHLKEALRLKPDNGDARYWLEQATALSTAPSTSPATGPAAAPATGPGK